MSFRGEGQLKVGFLMVCFGRDLPALFGLIYGVYSYSRVCGYCLFKS